MAVHLRTRLLLVAAVTVLGVATWLNVDAQRARMADRQRQVVRAADLRTAMVDQETGVRGFDQTGSEEFLEPFERGRRDYLRTLAAARRGADDPQVARQLAVMAEVAARWQALAGAAVGQIRREGPGSLTVQGARERKAVMDRFRTESALFRSLVMAAAVREDAAARWVSVCFVVAAALMMLGGGLLLIERAARRSGRRRRLEDEFVATLQGADDEAEAQDLLRRHVERSLPGAAAVVLSRDASNRQLLPVTDADAIAGLGDRLEGAAPRDCLAVRRGAAYERRASQPCTICGDIPGASRCTPSLVGGEVIGSLLVTRHGPIEADAATCLSSAVNQAAPVLANLRNLAIAEHRAATDGLTGLPNPRSVRETLLRMVAQAGRTVTPLSAVAMDLERFKALNDRHDHQAGDEALAAVGAVLRGGVRASDFAGRWGGEEFVILLPDTDAAGAAALAEKLRAAIAAAQVPSVPAGITASFGAASLPEHAHDADSLLRAADRALYAAKQGGRDRVELAAGSDAPVA
ncbi:MAG TPA: diguanylate cyclase [Solirubrobacteraceae bacterium]|nr:diguanylate cyclase [Solirubrobacteraceae bacterium]